jgi:hypothetical protein
MNQELERDNARLRKALKYLIAKVRSGTKQIRSEVEHPDSWDAAKRVGDQATVMEAAAIVADTVFNKTK